MQQLEALAADPFLAPFFSPEFNADHYTRGVVRTVRALSVHPTTFSRRARSLYKSTHTARTTAPSFCRASLGLCCGSVP